MLTVWCVWWRDPANPDKYSAYHVLRLKTTVAKNLTIPHRFVCITSERLNDVETMPPSSGLPGWWGKLELWRPGVCDVNNLYLDLDVVITGSLDEMVAQYADCVLAAPSNWAQSGHGGVQSSVLLWRSSRFTLPIWKEFKPEWAHWPPVNKPGTLWGDQEWITRLRDAGRIEVTPINPAWVKSYKYHCRDGLPPDTRVCVFHGDPKPENVRAAWFQW